MSADPIDFHLNAINKMKRETKEKVEFLIKWLLVILSVLDFILNVAFVFLDKQVLPEYPVYYDIRYYHWYLALSLLSIITLLYGTLTEDYLWLWSAGTMVFIVLFLGITGEASFLLLAPFSFLMLMAFVYGYAVRYRPRNTKNDHVGVV